MDSTLLAGPLRGDRGELPRVPAWVVPRHRLADRLDLGNGDLVTLVTGPTGSGKTMGVASWAASPALPGRLIWLSLAGADADRGSIWELLRGSVMAAGDGHLAPLPPVGAPGLRRQRALAALGTALRHGGPWVVVLDDFPTGPVDALGEELAVVLHHAQRGARLIVISRGEPAIAVHRHHVAGDLSRVTASDLAMDAREVAGVLDRHGVDASEHTARVVEEHTGGWPCGVRLAALALQTSATLEAALDRADRAAVGYLASEVLATCPASARELIVSTSMLDEVSPELAGTVLGTPAAIALDPGVASEMFVDLRPDGSFRCHPLLRAAALAQLESMPGGTGQESRRRAVRWYLDHGHTATALDLAMAGRDWAAAARVLVESLVVPRILSGATTGAVETALAAAPVRAEEPLIRAAMLLRNSGPDAAEAALDLIAGPGEDVPTVAARLSAVLLRLGVARARGEVSVGVGLAAEARRVLAHLPLEQHYELSGVLDAQLGALDACAGELHRAALTLRRGVVAAPRQERASPGALECLGQVALLDAFQGHLRPAERSAGAVLKAAATAPGPGDAHAHLAIAWVHLERLEPVSARQHLDRAVDARTGAAEPWFDTVLLLAEARWENVTGHADAAVRLLAPAVRAAAQTAPGWRADLLTVALADALRLSGEPRRALRLVEPGPGTTVVENGVVAASSLLDLGDVQGARAASAPIDADLATLPLGWQLEAWLLQARLAEVSGRREHAGTLVGRALRAAEPPQLRRPFAHGAAELAPLVERDAALRRTHSGFLAGLRAPSVGPLTGLPGGCGPVLIETLTVREGQVLALLAEMYSTEEVAAQLFLSVNTVKTHVRGVLRKLSVNRRVDAVRRGRDLGLC